MLSYNDVTQKKVIVLNGEPYEVLSSHVFRKQQRKPVNQTKLRSLTSGRVIERTFHQSDTIEEADVSRKNVVYLYTKTLPSGTREHWFSEEGNPKARFTLPDDVVGNVPLYVPENAMVEALLFEDNIVGVRAPIKVDLRVTEAPPAVRGDTAQGGTKQVVLETGAAVNVPLFIQEDDVVRINTETGSYVERVEKAKK